MNGTFRNSLQKIFYVKKENFDENNFGFNFDGRDAFLVKIGPFTTYKRSGCSRVSEFKIQSHIPTRQAPIHQQM